MKVLVTYASAHGSTAEVATFIGRVLNVYDVQVTVAHADTVADISDYDAFVLGSAVHSSMWLPSLSQFMFRFEKELANKPVYMWLNCIIVLEEGGEATAMDKYLWSEALERLNLSREQVAIFAGKMDWSTIRGDEKWILSSRYEGNELPGRVKGDYRDWNNIAAWAHHVAEQLDLPLDFSPIHTITTSTKNETITEKDVETLSWPDNPGEAAPL